jgi:hypothetical protein
MGFRPDAFANMLRDHRAAWTSRQTAAARRSLPALPSRAPSPRDNRPVPPTEYSHAREAARSRAEHWGFGAPEKRRQRRFAMRSGPRHCKIRLSPPSKLSRRWPVIRITRLCAGRTASKRALSPPRASNRAETQSKASIPVLPVTRICSRPIPSRNRFSRDRAVGAKCKSAICVTSLRFTSSGQGE